MKPLVTSYRVLIWLSVCPPEEPIDGRKKLAHFLPILIISMINVTFVTASGICIHSTLSGSMKETLFAFAQFASFSGITYLIIAALTLRHSITVLFGSLSRIYQESKSIFGLFSL